MELSEHTAKGLKNALFVVVGLIGALVATSYIVGFAGCSDVLASLQTDGARIAPAPTKLQAPEPGQSDVFGQKEILPGKDARNRDGMQAFNRHDGQSSVERDKDLYLKKADEAVQGRLSLKFLPEVPKTAKTIIAFDVDGDGKLGNIRFLTYSGYSELDHTCADAISEANLPLLPLSLKSSGITVIYACNGTGV